MADDWRTKKPTNVIELIYAANELSRDDLANDVKAKKDISVDFNDDNKKINLDRKKRLEFKNGDYSLKGHMDIQKGAEILGQQLIDQAEKLGMKITDLKEFKNADLNKDGKVDAKEVGAMLLAASMDTQTILDRGMAAALGKKVGDVTSRFDNKLDQRDMEKLRDSKAAEKAKEIAEQILVQNGEKVPGAKSKEQFKQSMKEKEPRIIGQGSQFGPKFVSDRPEDQNTPIEKRNISQVRGKMEYEIVQTDQGIIARGKGMLSDTRIVDAKIEVTIKGADGKDKRVTIEIGKDGYVPKEKAQELLKLIDPKEGAKEEVQKQVTKPAEAVKAGVVGHGSQAGLKIDHRETVKGFLDYKIVRGEDGKLTAQAKPYDNGPGSDTEKYRHG